LLDRQRCHQVAPWTRVMRCVGIRLNSWRVIVLFIKTTRKSRGTTQTARRRPLAYVILRDVAYVPGWRANGREITKDRASSFKETEQCVAIPLRPRYIQGIDALPRASQHSLGLCVVGHCGHVKKYTGESG